MWGTGWHRVASLFTETEPRHMHYPFTGCVLHYLCRNYNTRVWCFAGCPKCTRTLMVLLLLPVSQVQYDALQSVRSAHERQWYYCYCLYRKYKMMLCRLSEVHTSVNGTTAIACIASTIWCFAVCPKCVRALMVLLLLPVSQVQDDVLQSVRSAYER